jgi:hypothetical protein
MALEGHDVHTPDETYLSAAQYRGSRDHKDGGPSEPEGVLSYTVYHAVAPQNISSESVSAAVFQPVMS